jgi:ABC-type molybdenum transport system ATPase subunit/photorepair protein PhrA
MDIKVEVNRQFRSFKTGLESQDLNKLVVLTGKNGAGKSQLLQILESRQYIDKRNPQTTATVVIDNQTVRNEDIIGIFDWNMPSAPSAGMAELHNTSQQIVEHIVKTMNGERLTYDNASMFSYTQREELTQIGQQLATEDYNGRDNRPPIDIVLPLLSDDFSNKSAQIINERIASIIYDWHFTAFENNESTERDDNPITIFNELCSEFDTGYHLPPLTRSALRQVYVPQLLNNHGDRVNWNELSSGEQVLFRVICWLFYYHTQQAVYPKLILLDEPDAHLTPKMIRKLIDSLQTVLVGKMGVAVVMTSHSPNTVALCDEQSLYELLVDDEGTRSITKITRNDALKKFSEGLLFVQEDTRLVFVEGKDDIPFYQKLLTIAMIRHNLNSIPSMKFIAASAARPDHGGSTKVMEMVPRFIGTSIESLVYGVIDNDNRHEPQQNILVLKRYAIENYLYDPLIIAIILIIKNKHVNVLSTVSDLSPDEYVKIISDSQLRQRVVNEIISILYQEAQQIIEQSGHGSEHVNVTWFTKTSTSAIEYTLPEWFIKAKKSDLLQRIIRHRNSTFKDLLNDSDQYLAIETTGAIPEDILDILKQIQGV